MNVDRRNQMIWLAGVCALIYLMIVVGGVTRLTQSGLSMVDWRPLMGVVPPLTAEDWQRAFAAYKQYPEYRTINQGMTLDEFRGIFYWEYAHRLLGRVIGLVYLAPFVVFLLLGRIEGRFLPRLWVAFLLGGLQGLIGWYMVKSGLIDTPHVSHYRLAAHLLLAIFILSFLFWLILDLVEARRIRVTTPVRVTVLGLAALLGLQLLFGAFTAGLDAGRGFNTWPLMHGRLLADAAVMMTPWWLNVLENGVMIQFVHRWIGALLLAGTLVLAALSLRAGVLVAPAMLLAALTLAQFLLGVATLLLGVPVVLGSLHQAVACLMVLAAAYLVRATGPVSASP